MPLGATMRCPNDSHVSALVRINPMNDSLKRCADGISVAITGGALDVLVFFRMRARRLQELLSSSF